MSSTQFKVGLRLIPQNFHQANWQTAAKDYADYLNFYSYQTDCLCRYGWLKPLPEQRVFAQAFKPSNKEVQGTWLHLHGYFDHSASYPSLQAWVLKQNWAYLSYDLLGHGLSNGKRTTIKNFNQYQAALDELVNLLETENWPKPWVLSGFSTGGALALQQQLTHKKFAGLVLLAPLVEPDKWNKIRRVINPLSKVLPSWPRSFRPNSSDADYLAFMQHQDVLQGQKISLRWAAALKNWLEQDFVRLQADSQTQCLILQGDADTTLTWQTNLQALSRLLPAAKTVIIPQAQHQLLNENLNIQQQVYAELAGFLAEL